MLAWLLSGKPATAVANNVSPSSSSTDDDSWELKNNDNDCESNNDNDEDEEKDEEDEDFTDALRRKAELDAEANQLLTDLANLDEGRPLSNRVYLSRKARRRLRKEMEAKKVAK
ncbi:hypothetical protein BCR33DRAFT_718573 [Rhizoclosmatium globosum]|uniref:Uncharacterized protein n=1 Tax=Rhizoclosmatium globosum TaxID=329046 RepID=A0A1Y2C4F8_9FUNG|nr:hypothetical protein BCR33DRAFT_718573 [Rhizoclosmatium globosum]|eukprot:ORY41922.1 hypothetical protein BCR33DRAFT_718573 [Rhizoclosmatium globosum]